MSTKVINIKTMKPGDGFDVYIGRKNIHYAQDESIWHNPFQIGVHGDRDFCIDKYELYLNTRPDLLKRIKELKDKTLACYCFPYRCHGVILAKLADSKYIRNWFSNILPFDEPLIYQGLTFKTVENFYQAMKLPRNKQDLRKEISEMSPFDSKKNIRNKEKYPWDNEWNQGKALKVMEYALRWKFKEGTTWHNKLKMTEDWTITEFNNWNDMFWGVNIDTGAGENHLGKLLMKIRDNK